MRELPTGTVTLLFTDIEGSTLLLRELGPERYADVLAEHRRVLRDAFRGHGGAEVDSEGDAFFYAFGDAGSAVAAADEAQRVLAGGRVRVRMGLHTGKPIRTDEGYVGLDVHYAARLMSAGHGGQVLLSASTHSLGGATAIALGEHRLKDIEEPVAIFQLGAGSFPPLKTISNTNLPRPASSFVGRERELGEVVALLGGEDRLVTLTGPGGSGKTRLAIEAASAVVPEHRDGVFWVGLAPLRDSGLVLETVAQTLGAQGDLADRIGDRQLLLLLDNFEHLVEAAADVAGLLERCSNLRLLVTSRERLRVRGEAEYEVPPLDEREAVELFCRRSRLQADGTIAELCRRLDALPLAVELAAARTKALSPGQVLERLSQRLDLLKGGRDADPRQQTLRATIDWSYDLLSDEEQRLFRRLAVFVGGCTLEAAATVAYGELDTLQSLVEKSLVRFTSERYWLLETIREFASERLAHASEADLFRRRHADRILEVVTQLAAGGGVDASARLAAEITDFRAALAWAEEVEDTDLQLDLVGRSWTFWWYRGHSGEGLRWAESALARSDAERSRRRVEILCAAGMFASRKGELEKLRRYADEALALARALRDEDATIWPLILRGIWESDTGGFEAAIAANEEAIATARRLGNRKLVGIAHNNLGVAAGLEGDSARAAAHFRQALEIARELATPDEIALETVNLAFALHAAGELREAVDTTKSGLTLARDLAAPTALALALVLLAALVCRMSGANADAAKLLGAAEGVRDRVGEEALDEELARILEETERELATALGDDVYGAALLEGKAMPLADAVDLALALVD